MLLSRGQWSRRVLVSSGDGASEHWARKRVSCFRAFKGVGTLSPERAAHSDKTLPDSQVAASGQPGPHSPFLSGALPGGVAPGGPRVFGTARQGRGPPLTPVRPQSGILKAEIADSTCTEQGQRGAGGQPVTVPAPRGAGSRQKLRVAPVRLLLVVSRGLRKCERTTGEPVAPLLLRPRLLVASLRCASGSAPAFCRWRAPVQLQFQPLFLPDPGACCASGPGSVAAGRACPHGPWKWC